jgi:hypothetical protein
MLNKIKGNSRFWFLLAAAAALTAPQTGHSIDNTRLAPELRYNKAIEQFSKSGILGQPQVPAETYASLDWVEKTALINLVCPGHTPGVAKRSCLTLLQTSLNDDALVIRDHALRLALSGPHFSKPDKATIAQQVLTDPRNYRRGRPLWIVSAAKAYLAQSQVK